MAADVEEQTYWEFGTTVYIYIKLHTKEQLYIYLYIAALLCEVYELCGELCQFRDVSLMTEQFLCKKAI